MRVLASRKGFSLVELLTVIAIIAILASIIFPVMAMVSNKARMNKCITQLHQIGLGLQVFKQDNRRYPDILGTTVQTNGSSDIVPWEQTRGAAADVMGLFPEYVTSCRLYHCPNSKDTNTSAYERYDPNQYDPALAGRVVVHVYSYDSYDFMKLGPTQLQQHYARCWAGDVAAVSNGSMASAPTDPSADYERQLKFRTPPDTTVVTWCSWHEVGGANGKAPTLYLDGHVDSLPAADVENYKWRVLPKKE